MSISVSEPEWVCQRCGYRMDAVTSVEGDRIPRKGDITICLNCRAPYERTADKKWRIMTDAEIAKLDPRTKAWLKHVQRRIRGIVQSDLTMEHEDDG